MTFEPEELEPPDENEIIHRNEITGKSSLEGMDMKWIRLSDR